MTDDDIDFSDDPERDAQFLAGRDLAGTEEADHVENRCRCPRLFPGTGRGYQTLINRVLRKYVEAQKNRA